MTALGYTVRPLPKACACALGECVQPSALRMEVWVTGAVRVWVDVCRGHFDTLRLPRTLTALQVALEAAV